jgi:hypothetical protein
MVITPIPFDGLRNGIKFAFVASFYDENLHSKGALLRYPLKTSFPRLGDSSLINPASVPQPSKISCSMEARCVFCATRISTSVAGEQHLQTYRSEHRFMEH